MFSTRIYCVGVGVVRTASSNLSFIMHILISLSLLTYLWYVALLSIQWESLIAHIIHFGYFTSGLINSVLDKMSTSSFYHFSVCMLKVLNFTPLFLESLGILSFSRVEMNER